MTEHFIVGWLLDFIGDKIDIRQFGGSKGNLITHYIIELINFILSNQEQTVPTAVLACMVDFSKAFNRQDHEILITKLSDMNVPGWLLKLVIAFLSNRKMVVRYKGATSSPKDLPGGGPQGTLLGLLLFLVLINDAGYEGQENRVGENITRRKNFKAANLLHLKYVDDMTLAESVDLRKKLIFVPESARPLPDSYHARAGHALPEENSAVFKQLQETRNYAEKNGMKINYTNKQKVILFDTCKNWDFMPEYEVDGNQLELVEEMKILVVVLRADMI